MAPIVAAASDSGALTIIGGSGDGLTARMLELYVNVNGDVFLSIERHLSTVIIPPVKKLAGEDWWLPEREGGSGYGTSAAGGGLDLRVASGVILGGYVKWMFE